MTLLNFAQKIGGDSTVEDHTPATSLTDQARDKSPSQAHPFASTRTPLIEFPTLGGVA